MARTFYPRKTRFVPASEPHISGAEYKISVGDEDWGNGTYQPVVKVQMVYDGKVAGRKSPSYPVASGDWKTIQMVIDELMEDEDGLLSKPNVYMVPTKLTKTAILTEMDEIISLTEDGPSSEKTRYLDVHTGFISSKMTGIFEYAFSRLADDLKLLCDFNEAEGLETCDEVMKRISNLDSDDDGFVQFLLDSVEEIKSLAFKRRNENTD